MRKNSRINASMLGPSSSPASTTTAATPAAPSVSAAVRKRSLAHRGDGEIRIPMLHASREAVRAFSRLGVLTPLLEAHGVFLREDRRDLVITAAHRPPAGSLGEKLRRNAVLAARRRSKKAARDGGERKAYDAGRAGWAQEQEEVASALAGDSAQLAA